MIVVDPKSMQKLNRDINKISKSLIETHKNLKGELNKCLFKEANAMRNYIILSMRNTKKGNKIYKRGSVIHYPSVPNNPPAIDTGELARSIMYDVANYEMRVGVTGGAPYGAALELKEGKGKREWLKPAVEMQKDKILKNIKAAIKKQVASIKP